MSRRALPSPRACAENVPQSAVSVASGTGTQSVVMRSSESPVADERRTPPAEPPRTGEQELTRGRVEQTPFSMINWVAVVIGTFAALVLAVVVVAYVIA